MKNLPEIFNRLELDNLTFEEILWCRFANDLGFDPEYLHTHVIHIKENKAYKIHGLIWKFLTIPETMINFFQNELMIKLEYIPTYFDDLNKNISEEENTEVIPDGYINLVSDCNTTGLTTILASNIGYTTAYENHFENLQNEIEDLKTDRKINSQIKYPEDEIKYISISELINNYRLESNENWSEKIKEKPKFQLKIC